MDRPKQVQIPEKLFGLLCKHFILECTNESEVAAIYKGLQDKLDSITKRDLYSQYKDKSLSDSEREKARLEYLDTIGLLEDFRF